MTTDQWWFDEPNDMVTLEEAKINRLNAWRWYQMEESKESGYNFYTADSCMKAYKEWDRIVKEKENE